MRNRELILRIIVISLFLYATAGFAMGLRNLRESERQIEAAEQELSELKEENMSLKAGLASLPDAEAMEKLARERLGMIMPGEKIFVFTIDREEPTWCRK